MKTMENVFNSLLAVLKRRPDIILMITLVFGFLYYLDRSEDRHAVQSEKGENLATLRIDTCHDMQDQATAAMNNLANALLKLAESDVRLQETVSNLVGAVDELRKSNDDLRGVVVGLAAMYEANQRNAYNYKELKYKE